MRECLFFVKALFEQGVYLDRLKLVIAGGAHIMDQTGMLNIGEKNDGALKSALASYDIKIHHEDIGGTNSRTLSLEIGSGSSCIKIFGQAAVKV